MNIPIQQYLDLLRDYLKPQTGRVVSLAVLLLGGIGLQLLNPQIVRYFIDTVQNGGAQQQLLLAAAADGRSVGYLHGLVHPALHASGNNANV